MNGFENVPVSCIGCRCDDETSTFYIQFLETIKFGRRIQFVLCVDNTPLEVTISATTASMMSILPANTRLALPVAATTQSISVNNNLSPEQRPRVPNLLNLPVVKIPCELIFSVNMFTFCCCSQSDYIIFDS